MDKETERLIYGEQVTPEKALKRTASDYGKKLLNYIQSGTEALAPVSRGINALASQVPGLKEQYEKEGYVNPYAGKSPGAVATGVTADALATASNLAMPVKGLVGQAIKYGAPMVTGVAMKNIADYVAGSKQAQEMSGTTTGKMVGDYVMPGISIAMSLKGLSPNLQGIASKMLTKGEKLTPVEQFKELNPKAAEYSQAGINKLVGEGNTPQGLRESGFRAGGGKLKESGTAMESDIKGSIKAEQQKYGEGFERIKGQPIPKDIIKGNIAKLDEAEASLNNSRPNVAVKKDIATARASLKRFLRKKGVTLDDYNTVREEFNSNIKDTQGKWTGSNASRIQAIVSDDFKAGMENALPGQMKEDFKGIKESFGDMAEARGTLGSLAKSSPEQMIKKINTGEKIDAADLLAEPETINQALKSNSAAMQGGNKAKMVEHYLESLRKIDQINPELADKLFKNANLPIFRDPVSQYMSLFGGAPQTGATETDKAMKLQKQRQEASDYLNQYIGQ